MGVRNSKEGTKTPNRNDMSMGTLIGDIGKIPPMNIEMEEVLLGAIIIESSCLLEIYNDLDPKIFYKDAHQKVCQAILSVYNKNQDGLDLITVTDELRTLRLLDEAGGPAFVSSLTSRVASSAHVKYHLMIVKQCYFMREMIRISSEVNARAFENSTDPVDVMEYWQNEVDKSLNELFGVRSQPTFPQLLDQAHAEYMIREALAKDNKMSGIPTPIVDLTNITNGWQNGELTIIAGRPSMGKCLKPGTLVLMYNGQLKKVEDVRVGDQLMGPDSKPRNVLSTCSGYEQMYTIKQKNGFSYGCNESHILALKVSGKDFKRQYGEYKNVSVKDYFKLPSRLRDKLKGYKTAVDWNEDTNLLIPPYLLGIWLGDGSVGKPDITKPDVEIENYIVEYAKENLYSVNKFYSSSGCPTYSISNKLEKGRNKRYLLNDLRKLNVLHNKHIPRQYLINSRKNRMELLAGLIDTDGYNAGSSFEISQKDENLIRQIKFLADTLGFGTALSYGKKSVKSINFEGYYYRLLITGDVWEIPTKIKRKQIKKSIKRSNYATTYGIEVVKNGIGQYNGFELDGDGLFLLEDCTVTHNTALLIAISRVSAFSGHPVAIFSLEMPGVRLVDRFLCGVCGFEPSKYAKGLLNYAEKQTLNAKIEEMKSLGIYIDDNASVTMDYIMNRGKLMKKMHGLDMIILDYLQLVTPKKDRNRNRETEVGEMSRKAKLIAKELNIPVIVLAQLNRQPENRGGMKRPQLSDLRESGSLEQDSDNVILIYRAEYYKFEEYEDHVSSRNLGELDIAKQRNGRTGVVRFGYNDSLTQIFDYADGVQIPQQANFEMPFNANFDVNSEPF